METAIWYAALLIGAGLFLCGICCALRRKNAGRGQFAKAAAFEFAAIWVMYIPEELYNDIPGSLPLLKIVESILTALLRAMNVYSGNGYQRLAYLGHPVFSSVYSSVVTAANILLLLFVAGLILRFLDGPFQRLRLFFRKRRYTYIFPSCNEKTFAIAGSIEKENANILFACAAHDLGTEDRQRIDSIRGIYVEDTAENLLRLLRKKAAGIEIFLFGAEEEGNLAELEAICGALGEGDGAPTRIYVELSDTPWSLYDDFLKAHNSAEGDKLVINFVRTEENFAYNNLLKNSIFEHALPTEAPAVKEMRVLIVGMNERCLEMLKAVLHLGQMPGYRLTVMVIDDRAGRSVLREKLPEIYDECDREGDAIYRLLYRENIDFASDEFDRIIVEDYPDFTFAFVNAGDDLTNCSVAMRLNAFCRRNGRADDYRIQVSVKNRKLCRMWNPSLTRNLQFVGGTEDTYDYRFITMSDLEKGTVAIHKVRYPEGKPTWISYCNNEYNRHSTYARTLSFKYKVKLLHDLYGNDDCYGIPSTDTKWKIYEHMRWNVYTRTLGYVLADRALLDADGNLDNELRGAAKVHNDLVDYAMLSKAEQDKDALQLTPEIVAILKSI